ncbi:RDD family protein [Streptomyces sp. NPDC029216]|uniref:RDD family protein n=1 Tax=Streptomyces sp. NPDC029216 TaxID=3154701 RepID=UPI0033F53FDC
MPPPPPGYALADDSGGRARGPSAGAGAGHEGEPFGHAPAVAVRQRPVPEATDRAVFERMAERAVRPAGLVRRGLARTLDSLVLAGVAVAAALPLVPGVRAHLQAKVDLARASGRTTTVWLLDATTAGRLGLVLAAVLLFGVFYEALPTARWGRTPGKKLCGVRVLATATLRPPGFGAALRRWLVYAFLGLPGSLWCLVDRPRRQGWHDKAARTYVAR